MPNVATNPVESNQPEPALRSELRSLLLALPYRAFIQVAVHLLHSQGYAAARPAGRDRWKGRNTAGGWDAEADFSAGSLGTLRCIAQVKQFDTLIVAQRHVDELRGVALRAGAHQAILITLSTFSPPALRAAQASSPVAPVRLIDGDELTGMLINARLGVRRGRDGTWMLDRDYFATLEEAFGTGEASVLRVLDGRGQRTLSVTVRLDPPDGFPPAMAWRWEADMRPSPHGYEQPQ